MKKMQNFKEGAKTWFIMLGIFLVIMGIIWLFIRPSFNHWRMESKLNPIQVSYVQDGGSESSWFSDDYDYYVYVGFRGGRYRVHVSEGVYTGSSTPVFYYDASNDEIFEAGTGHLTVIIYFIVFAVIFIVGFVYMPLRGNKSKDKNQPDAPEEIQIASVEIPEQEQNSQG